MKNTQNIALKDNQFISPKIADAVAGSNSYGLDVSTSATLSTGNVDYIVFQSENIVIEVVGGITDMILSSLRVSLKIYKVGTVSPLDIYRNSQIDLFNENQVTYAIGKICERLKIESSRCRNILFDCIERLDGYRRNREHVSAPIIPLSSSLKKEALSILKSEDVLAEIKNLLERAGICDTRLGLQLFIAGISRITDKPLHSIILAPRILAHSFLSGIIDAFPKEHLREVTTISKHALSYPPTADYWNNKTLVLHQLESIREKDNVLLEYILQGTSKRLITEINSKTGNYQSQKKDVTSTINLISYSSKDYHPVFSGRQTLCLPISDSEKLQDALYEKEVKQLSGLWDSQTETLANQLLQQIQRQLENLSIYNPIIEQIDLTDFFGKDIKQLGKYLQLVNLITLLHQHKHTIQITKTKKIIEVKSQYMILALTLFRELWLKKDDELYFNVRSTFKNLKTLIKQKYKTDYMVSTFKLKEVRKQLGKSPVTVQRHFNTLEEYGKIERCGGNNRIGYQYKILEWAEGKNKTKSYEELIKQLSEL